MQLPSKMTLEITCLLTIMALNFMVLSTADIVMSDEIKAQIEAPETTPSSAGPQPIILSSPGHLSVLEGSSIILPCRVDNLNNRVVFWKRGRTRTLFVGHLRVDQDKRFDLMNRTFLQIEKVTPEYAGEYICQVNTNPPLELVHTVYVLVPPKVTLEPKDGHVTVKEGEPIFAKCIAHGHPAPVVTWKAITGVLSGGVKEKQGNFLAFPSAAVQHTGIYECSADNGVGKPAVGFIKIKVFYSPILRVLPLWVHAGPGSTAEFECAASSEPAPSLYWTKGSEDSLVEDRHVKLIRKSTALEEILVLKVHSMTSEHLGTYACYANNSVGSAFRTVEVSGLAEAVRFKSNSSGDDEESFVLIWSVKSYSPIIEYMLRVRPQKSKESSSQATPWIDVMIPADSEQRLFHSHKYNITGLEPGTAYEVVMQARSKHGWNHPSETFTFHTQGGEEQSDEWDKTTTNEGSIYSVITDLPIHLTDAEAVSSANRILSMFLTICLSLCQMFL